MGSLRHLAMGFLAMTSVNWVFNIASLVRAGDPWLGLLYFLIFLIPLSAAVTLRRLRRKERAANVSFNEKIRGILFSLQGVALACWAFDLTTTFYAIDVTRLATEVNPLGWPMGILGALMYYGPTVVMMYVLLFKIKLKSSIYVGIVLSAVTLGMGAMNFDAGAQNLRVFLATAYIMPEFRFNLLAVVLAADIVSIAAFTRILSKQPFERPEKLNHPNSSLQ
jgi:hypothetical protein